METLVLVPLLALVETLTFGAVHSYASMNKASTTPSNMTRF